MTVLPYVPSFGERLVPALSEAVGNVAKGFQDRSNKRAWEKFITPEQPSVNSEQNGLQGNLNQMQQQGQNQQGMSPLDRLLNKPGGPSLGEFQAAVNLSESVNPGSGKVVADFLTNKMKSGEKSQLQAQRFQHEQQSKAEPELLEREQKLNHYEQEGARFERLQDLFSPGLENKFPSNLSVGLLTKDGELRPTAAALLSPEAQESVKLIADNLAGAKDTFGARVTNFDLQAYLKRLPSLLNSPEGRRRVLRDLRLMNKLNTNHEQGVLDIVEREGGPGNISLSQAERRYRKENAQEISSIKEEFIRPEKKSFSSQPDPQIYNGRVIEDEETGEKYRSNGKEWVLEK